MNKKILIYLTTWMTYKGFIFKVFVVDEFQTCPQFSTPPIGTHPLCNLT